MTIFGCDFPPVASNDELLAKKNALRNNTARNNSANGEQPWDGRFGRPWAENYFL
jgi:hypothetical protein